MKKLIAIIAACVLVAVAVVLLVVFCGCDHEWDRNYDGKCDECGKVLNEVTNEEWISECNITNALIYALQTTESSDNTEGVEEEFSVVDGKIYPIYDEETENPDYSAWGAQFSALSSYFAFADSYGSFTFDKESAKYVCDKLTVNGVTYENISIMFNANKKLTSIDYFVQNDIKCPDSPINW